MCTVGEWAGSDGGMVGEVSRALAGREQATLSTRSDVSRMCMLARQTERAVGGKKSQQARENGKVARQRRVRLLSGIRKVQ